MKTEQKEQSVLSASQIEKRLGCLGCVRRALIADIPSAVRLISVEWKTNPAVFYFYYDRETSETDQEEMDEPFMHVDMDPFQEYYGKLIYADVSQSIDYRGDCVYARKEKFAKDEPLLVREHSQCSVQSISDQKQREIIKTFQGSSLQGSGALVIFNEPIGHYLNPTTRLKVITNKAIVYNGKIKRHVIPAVPSMSWLESLQKEYKSQKLEFSFDSHLYSEANRALLGRVIPNLLGAKVIWQPHKLQIYHKDGLSQEDREDLELVWFETLAGVAERVDLTLEILPVKSTDDTQAGGSCFYLKKEPLPN